jgi:hypothetical protein
MLSLDELRAMGVKVTVCKTATAKGVRKQVMRGKGMSAYVIGGSKPKGYTQSAY